MLVSDRVYVEYGVENLRSGNWNKEYEIWDVEIDRQIIVSSSFFNSSSKDLSATSNAESSLSCKRLK